MSIDNKSKNSDSGTATSKAFKFALAKGLRHLECVDVR